MHKLIKISEEQVFTLRIVKAIFTVSSPASDSHLDIYGISVIPHFLEITPNEIRASIINKSEFDGGKLDEFTQNGTYFINIIDYSEKEIFFFSNQFANKMLAEIWDLLTTTNDISLTASLTENKVKEFVLKHNDNLFKNDSEFDSFCKETGLTINNFIVPAKFSYLDIKLKEINARLELEQFFARRYLFAIELIDKLETRIKEYINNGNEIISERKVLIDNWIHQLKNRIQILKNYKDYNKLYDMAESNGKIEVKNSQNVNIINGNKRDINIKQRFNKNTETKSSRKIALWSLVVMIIGLILTLIIYWDDIFNY